MSVIDHVKAICDRLAPMGLDDLMRDVTGPAKAAKERAASQIAARRSEVARTAAGMLRIPLLLAAVLLALFVAGCEPYGDDYEDYEYDDEPSEPEPEPEPTAPGNSCRWADDGECDEPTLCPVGTDTADCAGASDPEPAPEPESERIETAPVPACIQFGTDYVSYLQWDNVCEYSVAVLWCPLKDTYTPYTCGTGHSSPATTRFDTPYYSHKNCISPGKGVPHFYGDEDTRDPDGSWTSVVPIHYAVCRVPSDACSGYFLGLGFDSDTEGNYRCFLPESE